MGSWQSDFHNRMSTFERTSQMGGEGRVAASIKVGVASGCFHREHSPNAYRIIDEQLGLASPGGNDFEFVEHESGPELLVFLALGTAGITLATSVINLVATIIKARAEGIKKGDHPSEPVELIIRRSVRGNEFREEKILRFAPGDSVTPKVIENLLSEAAKKLGQTDEGS
jgi:hypothetical protein